MSNDNMYKQTDAYKFATPGDHFSMDLGTIVTDEVVRISGNDQVIFAKNMSEEPIRVVPPKDDRVINVLSLDRTV